MEPKHNIGDRIYKIVFDENNVPKVVNEGFVIKIFICKDTVTYETNKGALLDETESEEDIVKNVWFWTAGEGEKWLQEHMDDLKPSLNVGDMLDNLYRGSVYCTATIKEVLVGGAYCCNSSSGIRYLDGFDLEMSHKEYIDLLTNGSIWYLAVDKRGDWWCIIEIDGEYKGEFLYRCRIGRGRAIQFNWSFVKQEG